MPPRRPPQASLPTKAVTTVPREPQPDSAPTRRPARNRRQASEAALEEEEGEHFDLTQVSGSDDDDESIQPAHRSSTQAVATTVQGERNQINDPTVSLSSNAALDVHYFFEKIGDQNICKECRQVFLPFLPRYRYLPEQHSQKNTRL